MGSTHKILCSFSPFEESRLSLPTIVTLFPVITPLSLGRQRIVALMGLVWKVWQVLGVAVIVSAGVPSAPKEEGGGQK